MSTVWSFVHVNHVTTIKIIMFTCDVIKAFVLSRICKFLFKGNSLCIALFLKHLYLDLKFLV